MNPQPLRVLFCLGINQNFFDLPEEGVEAADVWTAFVELMDRIKGLPGVDFIGDLDDDSHQVGPAQGWPWTAYLLCDVDAQPTVQQACGLLRSITVGESPWKLWKYAAIEARIGRALTPRQYES
ncbi:MAG: hypothetical protein IIZ13_16385 [Renibacterium sp.]|nr:hypothetical protein [Renibacterium sp.]